MSMAMFLLKLSNNTMYLDWEAKFAVQQKTGNFGVTQKIADEGQMFLIWERPHQCLSLFSVITCPDLLHVFCFFVTKDHAPLLSLVLNYDPPCQNV